LIKKYRKFPAVYFFSIFGHQNLGSGPGSGSALGSGSGSAIVENTGSGSALNQWASTTLVNVIEYCIMGQKAPTFID
jgi:hypothetical protein